VLGDVLGEVLGEAVGDALGDTLGDPLGDKLGEGVAPSLVGAPVGATLGAALGGTVVGDVLGAVLGAALGSGVLGSSWPDIMLAFAASSATSCASGGLKVAISTRVNAQKATDVPGAGGTSAIPARKQCTVTTLWPATSLRTCASICG